MAISPIASLHAQTGNVATAPVGYEKLTIWGASDNVISLPMGQMSAFAGAVQAVSATSITISSGVANGTPVSPNWVANQFVFNPTGGQRQTFFVEFTSGSFRGAYYTITANTADTLTLDTQEDDPSISLINHPRLATVAVNDFITIRPYWRVRDVFERDGAPVIEARPNTFSPRDDILIPSTLTGTNKAPGLTVFYVTGQGWRAAGQGAADFADYLLRPNEGFILRRRNASTLTLNNLGEAETIRAVSFVPGGNGTSANDTYISLVHPVPVTLDQSGLRIDDQAKSVIKDSASDFARQDELLAFSPASVGFNTAPAFTYYYRTGQGWKQVGASGIVGSTVTLQPGTAYIVRKKAANPGVDWVKDTNY